MSRKHPIIAVTGSSGAGTTAVRKTFEGIFERERVNAALIEGDSFHKYERDEMRRLIEIYENTGGRAISHFGPESNLFEELETLFREYSAHGTGRLAFTCTTKNARRATARKPARSRPGSLYPKARTCCFTKGSTAG